MILHDIVNALTMYGPMDIDTLRDKLKMRGHDIPKGSLRVYCDSLVKTKRIQSATGFKKPAFKV